MHRLILSVVCLAVQYFSMLSHNGTIFREKTLFDVKYARCSTNLFPKTYLILSRIERDSITNVHGSSCEITPYTCKSLIKLEFPRKFSKNNQICNFMKIRPMGTKLFHADVRTDGQTDGRSYQSLFAILRARLKTANSRFPKSRLSRVSFYFACSLSGNVTNSKGFKVSGDNKTRCKTEDSKIPLTAYCQPNYSILTKTAKRKTKIPRNLFSDTQLQ